MKRREVLAAIANIMREWDTGGYERDRFALDNIQELLNENPIPRCKCASCRNQAKQDRCFSPCNACS